MIGLTSLAEGLAKLSERIRRSPKQAPELVWRHARMCRIKEHPRGVNYFLFVDDDRQPTDIYMARAQTGEIIEKLGRAPEFTDHFDIRVDQIRSPIAALLDGDPPHVDMDQRFAKMGASMVIDIRLRPS